MPLSKAFLWLIVSLAVPRECHAWFQFSGGAATGPAGSANPSLRSAEEAFREGSAAFQRNDLTTARLNFEITVKLAPKIAPGHSALGTVLLALGDRAAAIRELETARQLDPHDSSALASLCIAYADTREYGKSVAAFRDLQANAPEAIAPDVATAAATALTETDGLAEAQSLLESSVAGSIATGNDDPRLHDLLGSVLAREQKFPDAEAQFRKAISLDDNLASAHFHLGSIAASTNRSPEAVAELTRSHALEPLNAQFTIGLSRALVASGKEAEAIALLRESLKQASPQASAATIELKYQLALALQLVGDAKQATPLFADVVAARPEDAQALTNAGLSYVQVGNAKTGVSLYLRALKLTPSDATLREDLGVAYLQQADLDRAIEQFRAGLAIESANPQLHYDLGLALKLRDDLPGAVPEFEQAATLDPNLPDPPYTLGIIYMQQGQFEKAAASLEKATTLRPDNGDAWATLGSVYQQMQQPDKAIPALRRAITLEPKQPSPHVNLGAILASQGHKEEAVAERKIGAELTRAATNRQKANFGLDSGSLLLKRGQTDEALVQFQSAVEADPNYAAAHLGLATALDRAGRKAEAAEERRKAAALDPASSQSLQ